RPEVQVTGGDFLYLSAPRPIVSPGTPFTGDLQAWIRNANLAPDWLRIGTDIIGGTPVPTFNMTFSLTGDTVAVGLIPGSGPGLARSDCYVELNVVGIANPGPDVGGGRVIACTDGDPCDTDGECGNGFCTLSVAVCINQTDPNLSACHPPTGLTKLTVSPKLAGAVPSSLDGSACGSFVAIPLPLKHGKQPAMVRLFANST